MDAQTTMTLRCTACGALAQASCNCGVPYANLSPKEYAKQRREQAIELRKSGLSMQQIADKLRVATNTISLDLADFPNIGNSKRGRPKKRKNSPKQEAAAANQVLDGTKTQKQAAQDAGLDSVQGVKTGVAYEQGRRDAFAEIGAGADFSKITAQQKRDAALRVYAKELNRQFEQRVQVEYTARVKKNFPDLDKMQREAAEEKRTYERLSRERKHIMSVGEFRFVLSCLHPDSRSSATDTKLKRAFQILEPKKFAITGEK